VDDLAQGERTFLLALNGEEIAGCVAVEQYKTAGLLRSLAVRTEWKGNGVGKTLVEKAETWAAANGMTHLYLLTTTAAGYFPSLGWKITERVSVPPAIAAGTEFASVCPASAVCMTKEL
jgi:amino-acid N-acetyltransferase